MDQAQQKTRNRPWIWIPLLILLSVSLGLVFYLSLPKIIERQILTQADRHLNAFPLSLRILKAGFTESLAGSIRLGSPENPGIKIESLGIRYSPRGLLNGQVDQITLSGVSIACEIKEKRLFFQGIDVRAFKNSPGKKKKPFVMPVKKISLSGGLLRIVDKGSPHMIPFEAELTSMKSKTRVLSFRLKTSPLGQEIHLSGTCDLDANTGRLSLSAGRVQVENISALLGLGPDLYVSGDTALHSEIGFALSPFALTSAKADITLTDSILKYKALSAFKEPVKAIFQMRAPGAWELSVSRLGVLSPVSLSFTGNRFHITQKEGLIELDGESRLTILENRFSSGGVSLSNRPASSLFKFHAGYGKDQTFSAGLTNKAKDTSQEGSNIKIRMNGTDISAEFPEIDLSLSGTQDLTSANLSVFVKEIQARKETFRLKIPKTRVTGRARLEKNRKPDIRGRISISGASLKDTALGASMGSIYLRFPFFLSGKSEKNTGLFSAGRLFYAGKKLGTVNGSIRQTTKGVSFSGEHHNMIFPGLKALFSGKADLFSAPSPSAEITASVPPFRPPKDINLGRFVPEAAGMSVNGTVSALGEFKLDRGGVRGNARLSLKEGSVISEEINLSVQGIETSVFLPSLPDLRSAPSQKMSFSSLNSADIRIKDGTLFFQLESPGSLLIEKCGFSWCKGRVDTQSIRILPGKNHYDLVLYCDRLNLSTLLKELAGIDAEGGGSLNGRIPIQLDEGRLKFSDGFLYSTPGTRGKISLSGTDMLTAGIPEGTPQHAQMDLTAEALKDYEYKWVKLGLSSEEETLLMKLQFDGKPARPLPFIYKKSLGGFMRVEAGSQGSHFQGISLDVNLKVPINQILEYKDISKMIN